MYSAILFCLVVAMGGVYSDNIACDPDLKPRVMSDPTGTFQSLNYPYEYPNGADCQWQIVAQPGQVIRVDFTTFDTERGYDITWFFDGDSILSTAIFGLSGDRTDLLPTNIAGSVESMYVWFSADAATTATGFNATYTSVDPSTVTGACIPLGRPMMLTGATGTFSSPYYSEPYPFACDCQWLITSQASTVEVDFTFFATQANTDWVILYNGVSAASSMIARLSGQYSPAPTDFVSTQQYMFIRFSSSEQISAAGFSAVYSSVAAVEKQLLI
jgi:cubilin